MLYRKLKLAHDRLNQIHVCRGYHNLCNQKHSLPSTKHVFFRQLEASLILHLQPAQLQTHTSSGSIIHMNKKITNLMKSYRANKKCFYLSCNINQEFVQLGSRASKNSHTLHSTINIQVSYSFGMQIFEVLFNPFS